MRLQPRSASSSRTAGGHQREPQRAWVMGADEPVPGCSVEDHMPLPSVSPIWTGRLDIAGPTQNVGTQGDLVI